MTRLADLDMDVEAEKLVPKAREFAKEIGHAAAIVRRGSQFFIADSWQPVEGAAFVLRLVSVSGVSVKQ